LLSTSKKRSKDDFEVNRDSDHKDLVGGTQDVEGDSKVAKQLHELFSKDVLPENQMLGHVEAPIGGK